MLGDGVNELDMSREEFEAIRDFIHEKSGIFFADNKMYLLKNRLMKRMTCLGIRRYRDYLYHVKYDTSLREFGALLNLVTTNETSFFRNEPQLKTFSDEVLPQLMSEKSERGDRSIKIWSAGCSTGEEPFTLAMLILDKVKALDDWQVEIVANDISDEALKKARAGEYSGATLRNVPPNDLQRHFERLPGSETYRLSPEVKALVRFSQVNLNDPHQTARCMGVDMIFCRNVMIYFSDDVKKRLVRNYYSALRPGGYFFVGHSETLHGISKAFKLVYFKNALVYRKEAITATTEEDRPLADRLIQVGAACRPEALKGAARALDLLSKVRSKPIEEEVTT